MPVDAQMFRGAMAHVASPVAVITTIGRDGRPHGFTASSLCSASLEPPMILVCVGKGSSSHEVFAGASQFMVNVLGGEHEDVARRFAARRADRFDGGHMASLELGLPGLPDALARLACRSAGWLDAGDHSILLGLVERTAITGGEPLVNTRRALRALKLDELAGVH